ncbi:methionine biosynthesis PLP-dependent protein [Ureibacillus thermosphaericus]|uniref:Cystathionine gamma-synthase n=1 Tax=Ureibacillus thermosphaericus TaxID=51173 RepID=A0A840PWN0_URETH|nr:methionine biosynthesis PLP-dependent protein [Ureibacillus thermosphaericus]MBB5148588.1 cystathionine gamma-synthase [Ureibacillus thermosphaericus]NKZ31306.1 methionine biosynthesis PLP-dependent protein [Ureibacillus thermosphaericus]
MTKNSIETKLVQLGNQSDPRTGAVNPPIYLSTAYKHTGIGESTGYDYIRTKNPTREILENGIAELEGGDAGFACSSGMAAIQLILSIFKPGDEIILPEDVYGGTYRLLKSYNELYNIRPVYFSNAEQVEELINEKTKAIFLETPTNPLMIEFDLDYFNQICKKHNLMFIVDNTFYSPYFQRPIEHGADIVMHSGTKYIAGHNDTLAGLVVSKGKELSEKLAYNQNSMGLVLSPFDSWLVIRGLKTLHLRMKQHDENAKRVVKFLKEEPLVTDVLYTGKGGMLSFKLQKSDLVNPFLKKMKLITFAESLGGPESFITYPATQTHADIPYEERVARGVDDCLLRFSVGLENAEDIIADLKQVFNQLREEQ